MITLEQERRYLILLSVMLLGGAASKKESLDLLEKNNMIALTDEDKVMKPNIQEPTWRSDMGFIRKHLERLGYLDGSIRGIWRITISGILYFFDLCKMMHTNFNISYHKVTPFSHAFAAEYVGDAKYNLDTKTTYRPSVYPVFRYRMGEAFLWEALCSKSDIMRCAFCGVDEVGLLAAVRPKPWTKCTEKEKLDFSNGLILCPCHAALLRKGLLTVDESGAPLLSSRLSETSRKVFLAQLPEHLELPEEIQPYLTWHRTKLFQK